MSRPHNTDGDGTSVMLSGSDSSSYSDGQGPPQQERTNQDTPPSPSRQRAHIVVAHDPPVKVHLNDEYVNHCLDDSQNVQYVRIAGVQ
jgi:hypothetical protein